MKNKKQYRWRCNWDNGKGGYDPDYESCNSHGRFVDNIDIAIKKGLEHDPIHKWCYWGYAPLGWKNHSTVLECKMSSGKIKYLKECYDNRS